MNEDNTFLNPTEEKKGSIKLGILRFVFVMLALAVQIWLFYETTTALREKYVVFAITTRALAVLIPLRIYGKRINSAYKISWIVIVLTAPVFGVILYLLFGNEGSSSYLKKRMGKAWSLLREELDQEEETMERLIENDKAASNISYYLLNQCGYPVYSNSRVTYYGDTMEALKEQIACLKKAEKYIFMEYFAIQDSVVWKNIEPVLAERVANGVEVRVFYDDVGSLAFVSKDFSRRLKAQGIECRVFNPVIPLLNIILNRRDHRKITVIDGKVGFTGGYNLANEYFNITHPFGQWKDSGVKVEGEAVKNLVSMFLEMWSSTETGPDKIKDYTADSYGTFRADGYVQPYGDSPLDHENVGENVYLNMIKYAKDYIYISTPYLIIDDEMEKELILAATRGVDVRIVIPAIPDKRIVYAITKSYCPNLARSGVRIYQYTPGFIHAKQFVTDDALAAAGSINLDFRSLYLQFESSCLFSYCDAVQDVKADFEKLFAESEDVTGRYKVRRSLFIRTVQSILRLFSPLL